VTPDLMEEGARIREARAARPAPTGKTESGGRKAGFSRIATPGEVDITHGRILYLEDVSVSFDGFKAINKLSLDIAPGELRCIIGPNGAGKTTMMDIITGKTRPDSGTVFFGSTIDLLRHNEPQIAQLGIGRKFQKPTVFEQLSVFENLELALKTHKGVMASMRFRLDSAQSDRVAELLHTIHLADSVRRMAGNLSHGQKQWLEIGMLLMQDPKAAAARRARGRHDRRGNRPHRRALPHAQGQAQPDGGGARHELHQDHQRDRHRAVRRLGAGAGHAGPGAGGRARDRSLSWPMSLGA
jgi:urea transport system ATP-binding protein